MRALASMLGSVVLAVAATAAATAREDTILLQDKVSGTQTVTSDGANTTHVEYSFNDRGRGDHIVATWKLDAAGIPIEYSGRGNNYMKMPVSETFRLARGKASWRNTKERGEVTVTGPAFYIPKDAPPEFTGVLARALLKAPDHSLPLLPAGTARIEAAGSLTMPGADGKQWQLTQYRISGLEIAPTPVWLDSDGNTAAFGLDRFSVVAQPLQASLTRFHRAQDEAHSTWAARLAQQQTHTPAHGLVIRNAKLFDPRDLSVTPGTSVLIIGERIVRVARDADVATPKGAEEIDAHGRFLMPGLWDNHQHIDDFSGVLDIASGVTSTRDLANDTDGFLARVARFDAGTELGPRVFKAGIIDGTGALAGPTKMRVDSEAKAIEAVKWYAEHGYGQIKLYSSLRPDLVPVIVNEAHARGLRVSGHVPANMSAEQLVEIGVDELQHLNFIVLNFLFDTVKDTRNMSRFTAVAEHAHELGPDRPEVRNFIATLQRKHVVIDPTISLFEALFKRDPAQASSADTLSRFPAQVRRRTASDSLAVPRGQESAYREAFPAMLRLLKAIHDAGVTIIPGTDGGLAGYALPRELELYVDAGIPAAEVLRMATLTSAQVVGASRDRGLIAAGKLADAILVSGDPSRNIADIRNVDVVIKGGKVYDPAHIEQALGFSPRS